MTPNFIKMCGNMEWPKTAIICTLAPAQIQSANDVKEFVKAGMRIVRLNLSHIEDLTEGEKQRIKTLSRVKKPRKNENKELESLRKKQKRSHDYAWRLIKYIRKAESDLKMPIGIMIDLCGPRLRTGSIKGGYVEIEKNKPYKFTSTPRIRDGKCCYIPSDDFLPGRNFVNDVGQCHQKQKKRLEILKNKMESGHPLNEEEKEDLNRLEQGLFIYVNDGRLKFEVKEVTDSYINCRIVRGGKLESRKGVNVPYCNLGLPSITAKDRFDLAWIFKKEKAERQKYGVDFVAIDFIAQSFVKVKEDIIRLRGLCDREIPIIAKIETPEALKNLKSIMEITDGVMVARGDLGVEIGLPKIPKAQRDIINIANATFGAASLTHDVGPKFVIVATQMLESMIKDVQPLRAEVADIDTAILEGADAIMTSAETIEAQNPIEVVKRMAEISLETEQERNMRGYRRPEIEEQTLLDRKAAQYIGLAESACILAQNKQSPYIIVSTWSGRGAKIVSNFNPCPKIIAITNNRTTMAHLLMYCGVYPVLIQPPPEVQNSGSTEVYLEILRNVLKELNVGENGEDLIAFLGIESDRPPIGPDTVSNTVRLFKI